MAFTAQDVKTLREKTGAGMMDCKKALDASSGDMDKAVEFLRKQGLAAASKKAGRIAAEGAVRCYVSEDGKTGALVEVNCETDFVAKTDDFLALVDSIAKVAATSNQGDVEAVLKLELNGSSVEQNITEAVARIGEKITLRRIGLFQVPTHGQVVSYIHGAGSIGVLVSLATGNAEVTQGAEFKELGSDLAMHVAAVAPKYLTKDEVPQDAILKEIDIYKEVLRKEGKKEEMLDKIAEGKLGKFFEEICLLNQPFVKESKLKVEKLLEEKGKALGASIAIQGFHRFVLGEGIEKKQEDFASEVMSQVNKS